MTNRMSRQRWTLWMVSAASLGLWFNGAIALEAQPAQAGDGTAQGTATPGSNSNAADTASTLQQIGTYGSDGNAVGSMSPAMRQVTSVSQFSDVKPTDWAFQALQSLVERYGCIVGYPDKTYRGNRALTRYEFAAGLNACLDKIQELIAAATADFVKKEDLEVVKRLQEEFAAELVALRGRVTALEIRTATLEKQQFSTTTRLNGEVIFGLSDTFGDRATRTGNDSFLSGVTAANKAALRDDQTQAVFQDRVRLAFDASFNGRDRLRARLQARNLTTFSGAFTGTNQTRLGYDGVTTTGAADNSVQVDKLFYRFPVGQKLRIQIDAISEEFYDSLLSTLSPFESAGQGSVSRFGRFNPIYRSNSPDYVGNAGASFDYAFSPQLSLQGAFSSDRQSSDPGTKNGLFNGDFTAIGQIVFRPSRTFDISLSYARSYYPGNNTNGLGLNTFAQGAPNITGSTGTAYASNPFNGEPTTSNHFSAQVQWRVAPKLTVGGWYGYAFANNRRSTEEARVVNWAGFVGLPDFGGKGNLLGLLFGLAPRVVDNDYRARIQTGVLAGLPNPAARRRLDEAPPFHAEVFYRLRLSDNISITPGVFVLFNPEGNSANATQYVGTVRTTFSF